MLTHYEQYTIFRFFAWTFTSPEIFVILSRWFSYCGISLKFAPSSLSVLYTSSVLFWGHSPHFKDGLVYQSDSLKSSVCENDLVCQSWTVRATVSYLYKHVFKWLMRVLTHCSWSYWRWQMSLICLNIIQSRDWIWWHTGRMLSNNWNDAQSLTACICWFWLHSIEISHFDKAERKQRITLKLSVSYCSICLTYAASLILR